MLQRRASWLLKRQDLRRGRLRTWFRGAGLPKNWKVAVTSIDTAVLDVAVANLSIPYAS